MKYSRKGLARLLAAGLSLGSCESGDDNGYGTVYVEAWRRPVFAGTALEAEATTREVELGARLFQDSQLSKDSTVSCATCHVPSHGFAEPRPVSHGLGIRSRKRNAPTLINLLVYHENFDWDGRALSLEEQLEGVFTADGDMGIDLAEAVERINADKSYSNAFLRAYGRPVDMASLLAALVAFERSLVATGSRFDRFYLGGDSTALTPEEKRGWELFQSPRTGCVGCHVAVPDPKGSNVLIFTDWRYHNLGVGYSNGMMEDLGRYAVTHRQAFWGNFRTPSLNNVALTAPYMHDGSLATLEDVVDFYVEGGIANPNLDRVIVPRELSVEERASLVAFMKTLTTEWLADSAAVRQRLLRTRAASNSVGRAANPE